MPLVFLSLGSNQGDRLHALARATREVSEKAGKVVGYSSIYETEPWGFKADQHFLNLVLSVETILEPEVLIGELLKVEALMGREREAGGYRSRVIDIDILLYGDRIIENAKLQIPHARMHQRKFVLEPLVELAPDAVHPVFGITTRQILDRCTDTSLVVLLYKRMQVSFLFDKLLNSKT